MNFEFGLPDQRVKKQEVYPMVTLEYDGEHNHNRNIIFNNLGGKLLGFKNGEYNYVGISLNNESGKPAIVCFNDHMDNPDIAEHAFRVSKTKPWRMSDMRYYRALCRYFGLEEVGTHEFKLVEIEGSVGMNLELVTTTGEITPAEENHEEAAAEAAAADEVTNQAFPEQSEEEAQEETSEEVAQTLAPEVEEEERQTPGEVAEADASDVDVAEEPTAEEPQAEEEPEPEF